MQQRILQTCAAGYAFWRNCLEHAVGAACRWLDEKWTIDMDGFNADAVDAEGWYYALDFNYLK